MRSEILSFAELPNNVQLGKDPEDIFLVVYDGDNILQVFSQQELINTPTQALNTLKFGIDYAYALGAHTIVCPSPKVCAWLAHVEAEKYSDTTGLTPLQEKVNLSLMHQFNQISDRFAKNQLPQPIYKPTNNRIIAFKVKGDHGNTYSVDAGATHCTCAAGMKNQECWHIKMVDIYLKGVEYERV